MTLKLVKNEKLTHLAVNSFSMDKLVWNYTFTPFVTSIYFRDFELPVPMHASTFMTTFV